MKAIPVACALLIGSLAPAQSNDVEEIAVVHVVAQYCELKLPNNADTEMANWLANEIYKSGAVIQFAETIVETEQALTKIPDSAKPIFCEAAQAGLTR